VRLKFAEIYFTAAGLRKFDIVINGVMVSPGFDIVAQAGAANTAIDKVFAITTASGITIQLVPVVSNPKISSIEITQGDVQVAVAPSISPRLTPGNTAQFSATVVGNANTAVTWSVLSGGGVYRCEWPVHSSGFVHAWPDCDRSCHQRG